MLETLPYVYGLRKENIRGLPWLQAPFCRHLRTRGSWRKAQSSSLWCRSAQNHRLKKKKMFTSEEKLLLKQQRENARFDEIVTQTLGSLFLPRQHPPPLPPSPLLFKVLLNQATGAEDKMQLGVGSSGGMPGLEAGPAPCPLHLRPRQPGRPGSVSACRPCRGQPGTGPLTPLCLPGGFWTQADRSDSEAEAGQATNWATSVFGVFSSQN